MEKYIDYIKTKICKHSKDRPIFYRSRYAAITKLNVYVAGTSIITDQYYHIVAFSQTPPNILEGEKMMCFFKNHFIMLPPNKVYKIEGEAVKCPEFYYLIINRHLVDTVIKEYYGVKTDVGLINVNVQAQAFDLINRIMLECKEKREGYNATVKYQLSLFIAYILRARENKDCADEADEDDMTGIFKACEYIIKNYGSDISIEELARIANTSKYHFIRQFKETQGITPHQFVKQYRLNKAYQFLKNTDLSIGEVARMCAFISTSHFASDFKKQYNITPSECKQNK